MPFSYINCQNYFAFINSLKNYLKACILKNKTAYETVFERLCGRHDLLYLRNINCALKVLMYYMPYD